MSTITQRQAYLNWAPLAGFFFFQFLIRVSPGIMAEDIERHFGVTAAEFGDLVSFFYIGYAALQLPIGMLLDLYGPRYIGAICICLLGVGTILLGTSSLWSLALVGQLLIGMGSSGAFISAAQVVRSYFPERRYTMLIAITVTIGLIGAIVGCRPVSYLVEAMGWQHTLLALGSISIALAGIILGVVKNPPRIEKNHNHLKLLKTCWSDFIKHRIVLVAIFGALMGGPLYAIAGGFGSSYFFQGLGISKDNADFLPSLIFIGMATGGPILGWIGEKYRAYRLITQLCAIGMAVSLALIFTLGQSLSGGAFYAVIGTLLFLVGVLCNYQVMVFSLVVLNTSKDVSGSMIGIVNTVNMLGGPVFLSLIGRILEWQWDGTTKGGVHVYSLEAYHIALGTIIVGLVMGFLGFTFMRKEKKA
jgi:MFS family permease